MIFDERPFLGHFESKERGWIFNVFLNAVRQAHKTSAHDVYLWVFADMKRRVAAGYGRERGDVLKQIMSCLLDYPDEAHELAALALTHDSQPAEQKQARREIAAQVGKQRYMEAQEPTEPQLRLLRKLGCTETPPNRFVASQWIDRLLNGNEAA